MRRLSVLPADRQRLACLLDVEAQPRPRSIPQADASQTISIAVDPVAGDAKLLGKLTSIYQPNLRTSGRNELSDVLCYGLDFLDVQRSETLAALRKKLDFARNDESEL